MMVNGVNNWIEKWLTHRRQRVIVDGEISNWKPVLRTIMYKENTWTFGILYTSMEAIL